MKENVFDLVREAIHTDGSHHKQWYLIKIAKILNIDTKECNEGIVPTKTQPLLATPPCPKHNKEKGHMNRKDKGLFWECECGFCWWKHDWDLPKNLQHKKALI